ncbi:MAG: CapA family protein [Lachnospiraceae bacterium]|nr:CapA family protein [Lachnospiraceae bacterium]
MKKSVTLTFTGDIGFDKYMRGRHADADLIDPAVSSFLRGSNHLIVNVEGPLYAAPQNSAKTGAAALVHSMDPAVAGFLSGINADIWNICNNHIMDCGPDGLLSTVDLAKSHNAKVLGAGINLSEASKPLILPEAGGIGMIGVGYQRACRKAEDEKAGCFSWSDLDLIKKRIEEIKETNRWCIVVAHAGEEFTALPSPYTRQRYMTYLEMGADIVIAHHPHVVNNYELVGDKAIFYSLGNFIFDTDYQRSQFGTQYGILLKLFIDEDKFSFEPFAIEVDRKSERIVPCDLPVIFTDVCEEEYEKLKALAAKVFVENTKRQLRYMRPEEFENATEDDFVRNFYEPLRSGRVPGETLDMQIMYPLSQTAKDSGYKDSTLPLVVDHMLAQIEVI